MTKRYLAWGLIAAGAGMIPWLFVLAAQLPATARAWHWPAAWVGLDSLEALGLLGTGALLARRDDRYRLAAVATATLLVADAWLDVTTAAPGRAQLIAVAIAACPELPLAALCAALGLRAVSRPVECGGMGRLDGKQALITGGTTGIGLAIAERFLHEGAAVVVTGRNEDLGRRAEAALRGVGQARFLAADAADPAAVTDSVAGAVAHLGALDVLVNNAGIGVDARLLDTPLADYDRLMDVNVRGYFLYAQAAYPHLAARRGSMIHISSDAGVWGEQSIGLYSVSKAAVLMLGRMLALDGGRDGVRSNVLCPGDIWPGMRHMAPPGEEDRPESGDWPVPPIGRIGEARDVASAAVFYASDEAEFLTGTHLLVDGGMTAGYLQREHSQPAAPHD